MVYVTLPPLFVVKDGQQRIYCQDESERDAAVARLRATSKRKVEVQRNKGLGEMDADDFWNTVLDPQRRTVIRVHLDEGEAKLHHILFGGPPEGRRTWMADIASRVDTSALDLD
jgi:DNA gyrase subunit B